MTQEQIDPADDGITHINIWTGGATQLGKDLSNLSGRSMLHPQYGKFACLEGYWFWLSTGKQHSQFRVLTGFEARKQGKALPRVDYPEFQKEFKEGMYWRLAQHSDLSDMLRRLVGYERLPLKHYYVYGKEPGKQKVVDVTERHRWQLDFYEWWVELPENALLGKPVVFVGEFIGHQPDLLKAVFTEMLGANCEASQWAKDAVMGCTLTPAEKDYVHENYRPWHETCLDDILTADPCDYTFADLVDMYLEGLPKPKKYVVLKGEFRTDTAEVINALQMLGYTVLSRPQSGDEPVVVGDNSDPELAEALASVNVLVLTEQHVLNQEVV